MEPRHHHHHPTGPSSSRPRPAGLVAAAVLALLALVGVVACSSGGDQRVSTGDDVIHLTQPDQGEGVATAVYWARPYGDPRAIDLPTFGDAGEGPHPLVVYGSITNATGQALRPPQVVVRWVGPDDVVVHAQPGQVVDPHGQVVVELGPGASADVIVVVDDPELAPTLSELVPVIEEGP